MRRRQRRVRSVNGTADRRRLPAPGRDQPRPRGRERRRSRPSSDGGALPLRRRRWSPAVPRHGRRFRIRSVLLGELPGPQQLLPGDRDLPRRTQPAPDRGARPHDDVSAALAAKVAQQCLDRASINLDSVGLVLAAPARASFADGLASHLGVPVERIAIAREDRIHTAALIAAFHDADAAASLQPGNTLLFVAADSGVAAGAALYRVPDLRPQGSG
jgi:hypothetical protein